MIFSIVRQERSFQGKLHESITSDNFSHALSLNDVVSLGNRASCPWQHGNLNMVTWWASLRKCPCRDILGNYINPLTSVPAWADLDFARVRFWPQPPLERLFWSSFVLVVFGNVQPIRIHLLHIYLKAWGGPRREDFLSFSKKITFHSKWLPCSSRVNFQDGNISVLEGRITFWNSKLERKSSKEHSTS